MNSHRFAKVKVSAVRNVGAYLTEGERPEEIFLPIREQTEILNEGEEIIVFLYPDEAGRPTATMRLDGHIDDDTSGLKIEQKVSLLILGETALGFQAIIDGKHIGVLYKSEVFQKLSYATRITGYVKKIREDGKVDLILQPFGSKASKDIGQQILDTLKEHGGFLPLTDQSSPETIYGFFGVSKKKYKMALGAIYKQRLISIDEDGIRLPKR